MADCFISYSSADQEFAQWVANELRAYGLTVFMADQSLRPGDKWAAKIRDNLAVSNWIVFLVSRAAAGSPFVLQEAGMALANVHKQIVPVVWDMAPSQLPGWLNETQALDLRGAGWDAIRDRVNELAQQIHGDKKKGYLIGAALLAGLVILGSSGE